MPPANTLDRLTRTCGRILRSATQHWDRLTRSRVTSAQTLSDDTFLALFDLGQEPPSKESLLAHYGRRVTSAWPAPPGIISDLRVNTAELDPDQVLTLAGTILANRPLPDRHPPQLTSEGQIAWHVNPTSDSEWLWALHRHQWWPILGLAYVQTGDERYATAFVNQMLDWIKENPPSDRKNESSASWRLMEVAMRMRVSWIPCIGLFYDAHAFSDQAKLAMLRSVYDHARFLDRFCTRNNHFLRESNGLAHISLAFPEFKEAGSWLESALSRLDQVVEEQINEDGSHFEVSTGYQSLVVDEFQTAFDLLRANDLVLLKVDLAFWLAKMYDLMAYLVRPDGTFPHINDGSIYWDSAELGRAGETHGHEDWVYIGTGGQRGTCPKDTSTGFPNAGLYVMRSDWTKDARYLLFDAGPYGGHHGHEDKLSVQLSAFGQPFVVDSNAYTYDQNDPFRAYFVSSQAHNTVLVDGKSQVRRWKSENRLPYKAPAAHATWITQPGFDYVSASYADGYGEFSLHRPVDSKGGASHILQDVTHTRRILFVKPDYWIIVDELESVECHDYQVLFHTVPEVTPQAQPGNRVLLKATPQGAALHIVPAHPDSVKVSWISGSEEPIQGWHSPSSHEKKEAAAIIYEQRAVASTAIATLLYPCPAGRAGREIDIEPLVVDGGGLAFAVTTFRGRDYLLLAREGGLKRFGPYESTAPVAAICTDGEGNIRARFDGHSI